MRWKLGRRMGKARYCCGSGQVSRDASPEWESREKAGVRKGGGLSLELLGLEGPAASGKEPSKGLAPGKRRAGDAGVVDSLVGVSRGQGGGCGHESSSDLCWALARKRLEKSQRPWGGGRK